MTRYRTEHDSLGELQVPVNALYGAQTQRAVQNFSISGRAMPSAFIAALGMIKAAAAKANARLGHLDADRAQAIADAAQRIIAGEHADAFPVEVYQTGSGTSSNMNMNEVIARLASSSSLPVHPNDHVNFAQSSNDVIPAAIQVSACLAVHNRLLPALTHLVDAIRRRADELAQVVKTGRTHLMDAMPIRLDQELGAWAAQLGSNRARLEHALTSVRQLPLGGTAVGTGINADPGFSREVVAALAGISGYPFEVAPDLMVPIASKDEIVALSGQLKALAAGAMKVANDLRWMNSGPLAGLGEITLPTLQPGSSIMPGKVNPVIPEALAMVCARVMGNDVTITIAGQSGNFQLNVMLPVIADTILESIDLLANGLRSLADQVIAGFEVNPANLERTLARNPVLITALNAQIGYERGAEIAKRAYAQGRSILEVARETLDWDEERLKELLDPMRLTHGGLA